MDFRIFSFLTDRKQQSFIILICQQFFFYLSVKINLNIFHDQLLYQLLKVPRLTIHHNR